MAGRAPATNQGAVVERAPGAGHSYSNIGRTIASPATGRCAVITTNAAAGEALMLEVLASIAHHGAWPDLSRR